MLGRGMRRGIGTATLVGVMGAGAAFFPLTARAQSNLGDSISSLPTPAGPDDSTHAADHVRTQTEPPPFDPKSPQAVTERKTHPPEAHPVKSPRADSVAQNITVNPVNPAIAPLRGGTPPVVAPAPAPAVPAPVTATSPSAPVTATPSTAAQPLTPTELEGPAPAALPANNEATESRAAAAAPNGAVSPAGVPTEEPVQPDVRGAVLAPSVVVTPPPAAEPAPTEETAPPAAPEAAPQAASPEATGATPATTTPGSATPTTTTPARASSNAPTPNRGVGSAAPNVVGVDSYGRSSAGPPSSAPPSAAPEDQVLPPSIGDPSNTLPPVGNP